MLVQWVAQKGWEARGPQVSVSPQRLWLEASPRLRDLSPAGSGRAGGGGRGGGPLIGPYGSLVRSRYSMLRGRNIGLWPRDPRMRSPGELL